MLLENLEKLKALNRSFADVRDLVESALAVFICSQSTSSSAPWIWLPFPQPLETTPGLISALLEL